MSVRGYLFLPSSAAGMFNRRQWFVDISRAKEELRVYTDCAELLEQSVVRPNERKSALSFLTTKAMAVRMPGIEHAKREAMLATGMEHGMEASYVRLETII